MAPIPEPAAARGPSLAEAPGRVSPRDMYCWGPGPPFCRPAGTYLSGGAIAAIVIGVLFFLALCICICWTYNRGNRRRRGRSRSRSYYTTEYVQTGVRGGGISDYEVSEFDSGSTAPVPRMKRAKTRPYRHSRR